jgi:hypothetical protein
MHPSLRLLAASAALTTALAGILLFPRPLHADGDGNGWSKPLSKSGVRVGDLVLAGRIVQDRVSTSGWAIDIRVENVGTETQDVDLKTDLTRSVFDPAIRAEPEAAIVWGFKDTLAVAPGKHVRRRYVLPMDAATWLTTNAAGFDRGPLHGSPMGGPPRPVETVYGVRFECPSFGHADVMPDGV